MVIIPRMRFFGELLDITREAKACKSRITVNQALTMKILGRLPLPLRPSSEKGLINQVNGVDLHRQCKPPSRQPFEPGHSGQAHPLRGKRDIAPQMSADQQA